MHWTGHRVLVTNSLLAAIFTLLRMFTLRRIINGAIVSPRSPPATFPHIGKIQTITLPEDVYVQKFFQKHPDSKHEDAIKYVQMLIST